MITIHRTTCLLELKNFVNKMRLGFVNRIPFDGCSEDLF